MVLGKLEPGAATDLVEGHSEAAQVKGPCGLEQVQEEAGLDDSSLRKVSSEAPGEDWAVAALEGPDHGMALFDRRGWVVGED